MIEELETENYGYQKQIERLLKENNKLQTRIDKAVEYIYENAYDSEYNVVIDELYNEIPELLNILKGGDE